MSNAADLGTAQPFETSVEERIQAVGRRLSDAVRAVTESIDGNPYGPAQVARTIGVDKVLAGRVLKATRDGDPLATLHLAPGPEPLRRYIRAAAKKGTPRGIVRGAEEAVRSFETLIRQEAGDRSGLDALLCGWLPEARANFELRRKQAAFRAMSELLGAVANVNIGTVLLHPSQSSGLLDVVWLFGFMGLRRLRAGSRVKCASRRIGNGNPPRSPQTLEGVEMNRFDKLRVDDFCSKPPPALDVHTIGDAIHYSLAGTDYGPRSAADLVFAEVNHEEMPHHVDPAARPRRQLFAEVSTPSNTLIFDALIHEQVFTWAEPSLHIYDTVLDGIADVNNAERDLDRLDLQETIQPMGHGISKFRLMEFPRYVELLRHVCDKLGWTGSSFRGYRCRIDYPIYGSQVVMTWPSREQPA